MTIYAVGDVHGELDKLKKLHKLIMNDVNNREGPHTVVFVGDYIDRGPDSKGVINFLMSKPFEGFKHVFLKGNHEDMMIGIVDEEWPIDNWLYNGGGETMSSYTKGDDPWRYDNSKNDFNKHIAWMRQLPIKYETKKYFFVHAGINPMKSLDQQNDPKVLLWIRDPFLRCTEKYDKIIVHGHTPKNGYENLHNRINIDTGAFYYGVLTAVALEDDGNTPPVFFQTE